MRILVSACLAACSLYGQAARLAGPSAGFVFDPAAHALRRIQGIPGAALVGAPVEFGFPLAHGWTSMPGWTTGGELPNNWKAIQAPTTPSTPVDGPLAHLHHQCAVMRATHRRPARARAHS